MRNWKLIGNIGAVFQHMSDRFKFKCAPNLNYKICDDTHTKLYSYLGCNEA